MKNRMSNPGIEGPAGLVAIGVSAGGLDALEKILPALPRAYALAVIVVQHVHPDSDPGRATLLQAACRLPVKEADEKEPLRSGTVYLAPPNYHLLVEQDLTLSLTTEERVCFARPSIDVLMETAADACGESMIGVLLTGANHDGSWGLQYVQRMGGRTLVQDPETAAFPAMPRAALATLHPDYVMPLDQIGTFLATLSIGRCASSPTERPPCNPP